MVETFVEISVGIAINEVKIIQKDDGKHEFNIIMDDKLFESINNILNSGRPVSFTLYPILDDKEVEQ